jgi:hypothetical protein
MKIFILLDYVLQTGAIVPTDPWVAYRYKREEQFDICPVCPTTVTNEVEYTDGKSSVGDDRIRFNQFWHITKDISCEQKRARAIQLGCKEREEIHSEKINIANRNAKNMDDSLDF